MTNIHAKLPSLTSVSFFVLLGLAAVPATAETYISINSKALQAAAGSVGSVQVNSASGFACSSPPVVKGDHCAIVSFNISGLKCTSGNGASYVITLGSIGGCTERKGGEFAKEGTNTCGPGTGCNLSYPVNKQCSASSPRTFKVDVKCGNVVVKTSPSYTSDALQ